MATKGQKRKADGSEAPSVPKRRPIYATSVQLAALKEVIDSEASKRCNADAEKGHGDVDSSLIQGWVTSVLAKVRAHVTRVDSREQMEKVELLQKFQELAGEVEGLEERLAKKKAMVLKMAKQATEERLRLGVVPDATAEPEKPEGVANAAAVDASLKQLMQAMDRLPGPLAELLEQMPLVEQEMNQTLLAAEGSLQSSGNQTEKALSKAPPASLKATGAASGSDKRQEERKKLREEKSARLREASEATVVARLARAVRKP